MKYTHILWDFNGTILDDVEAGIKSVNTLLRERSLKTVDSIEEYHSVFGFPIIEYYRKLGFDFEKESYEKIAPIWVEQYLINVKESKIYDGVTAAVGFFRGCGASQIILSATERDMLLEQLSELGIKDLFDGVLGLDNIHAASKVGIAKEWREEHPSASVLMIGDTVHDLEVANAIGADCALIAGGHQEIEVLKETGAPVYSSLFELISSLK